MEKHGLHDISDCGGHESTQVGIPRSLEPVQEGCNEGTTTPDDDDLSAGQGEEQEQLVANPSRPSISKVLSWGIPEFSTLPVPSGSSDDHGREEEEEDSEEEEIGTQKTQFEISSAQHKFTSPSPAIESAPKMSPQTAMGFEGELPVPEVTARLEELLHGSAIQQHQLLSLIGSIDSNAAIPIRSCLTASQSQLKLLQTVYQLREKVEMVSEELHAAKLKNAKLVSQLNACHLEHEHSLRSCKKKEGL